MRETVILSATRTAIGSFGGSLSPLSAVELGGITAAEAINRAGIDADTVDEVIVGNVLSAGLGQNIARQITLNTLRDERIPAFTTNMVCGSGLLAVSLAAQAIKAGECDTLLAGGVESMSNAPYLLTKARQGIKMGHDKLVDSMIQDGLWDAFNDYHMGITAENIAEQWHISRAEQDAYAARSQERAVQAIESNRFADEIVPVLVPQKKGASIIFDKDEFPRKGTTVETLSKLKPAFKQEGTVTAGNSSGINDGAAMLVLMEREKAIQQKLSPMGSIKSSASAGVSPSVMGYGVVPAVRKALSKAGLSIDDIGLFEINEAFAAQTLCACRELGLPPEITNVNGGAIALGHPIGASGARILTSLIHEMHKRNVKYGVAALCIGGGMGMAMVIEKR